MLVLSGGLPEGVPDDFYARLAAVAGPGARVVLDTHGPALEAALDGGDVEVVKPNFRELARAVGADPDSDDFDVGEAARGLVGSDRAAAVLVSLGAAGAMLVTGAGGRRLSAPTVAIRSRIGAGDSMVGGLVHRLAAGDDLPAAARFAVAAGTAAVMTPGTRLCRAPDVERLVREVEG